MEDYRPFGEAPFPLPDCWRVCTQVLIIYLICCKLLGAVWVYLFCAPHPFAEKYMIFRRQVLLPGHAPPHPGGPDVRGGQPPGGVPGHGLAPPGRPARRRGELSPVSPVPVLVGAVVVAWLLVAWILRLSLFGKSLGFPLTKNPKVKIIAGGQ